LEILIYSFNAVAPLCLMMALGYHLKQRGLVDEPFLKTGNALVFKVLLPVMIFDNTRKFDVRKASTGRRLCLCWLRHWFCTLCIGRSWRAPSGRGATGG